MKAGTRAAVAFIAGSIISPTGRTAIYDFAAGRHVLFSGIVARTSVSVFDHDQQCYIAGSGTEGEMSLYHYGDNHYITLRIRGAAFDGFDYDSASHFSGTVTGSTVTLYDYAEGAYYNFAL